MVGAYLVILSIIILSIFPTFYGHDDARVYMKLTPIVQSNPRLQNSYTPFDSSSKFEMDSLKLYIYIYIYIYIYV